MKFRAERGSITLSELAIIMSLIGIVFLMAIPTFQAAFCRVENRDLCVTEVMQESFATAPVCPTPSC